MVSAQASQSKKTRSTLEEPESVAHLLSGVGPSVDGWSQAEGEWTTTLLDEQSQNPTPSEPSSMAQVPMAPPEPPPVPRSDDLVASITSLIGAIKSLTEAFYSQKEASERLVMILDSSITRQAATTRTLDSLAEGVPQYLSAGLKAPAPAPSTSDSLPTGTMGAPNFFAE